MKRLYFIFLLMFSAVLVFSGCSNTGKETTEKDMSLFTGKWKLVFKTQGIEIPIDARVDNNVMTIINGAERIPLEFTIHKDSLYIPIPNFNSHIEGHILTDTSFNGILVKDEVEDYIIPLNAKQTYDERFVVKSEPAAFIKSKYEVFIDRGNRVTKAIGLFEQIGNGLTGSFVTETGDYRFLDGNVDGNKIYLSTFDGSHLFLFTAEIKGDSLVNGEFYSGKSSRYKWVAISNETFELHDPENLTKLNESIKPDLSMKFLSVGGDSVSLLDKNFEGKVKILQIMGTWCPNCLDETRYFNEIYDKYHDRGLEIIAVAFENGTNTAVIMDKLKKYKENNHVKYTIVYGGKASSKIAHKVFPYLDKIMSFPTTIYFDKQNNISKIYTGFYGPGTGVYYESFVYRNGLFLEQLLGN